MVHCAFFPYNLTYALTNALACDHSAGRIAGSAKAASSTHRAGPLFEYAVHWL